MKSRLFSILVALSVVGVLALGLAPRAHAQGVVLGDTVSLSAKVVGIDKKDRELTLRAEDGNVTTIQVSDDVRNFKQIKVGDIINVDYYEAVSIYLGEPGTQPEADAGVAVARAEKGKKPGAYAVGAVDVSAKVLAIDKKKGTVTLEGPDGNSVITKVDRSSVALDAIKVGDTIHARFTEAIAVSVTKGKK